MAGDRHGVPRRVRAPHRLLRCIGKVLCIGLILLFGRDPAPRGLHIADDGLTAFVNVNVLDGDLLLALPTVSI
jgi:hypothetical protein